jgi:spore coat polysaccharide biosynthesis protein SpsF (cytidylyltransferase family)
MMTSAWKNERYRLDVDNKAELQICVNIAKECTQIYRQFLANK